MDNISSVPRMMTVRQTAATGILPETALWRMLKEGTCPHVMIGNKAMINVDKLIKLLEDC